MRVPVVFSMLLFWMGVSTVHAQFRPFSADSIPVANDEVVFTYQFASTLDKGEFLTKAYYFLDRELDPYAGGFLANTEDSIVCRVTDYLEIEATMLQVFGMYMTYDMTFTFEDKACELTIDNIKFMEKSYFERQEDSSKEFNFREYSGKELMIDKIYSQLFKRNASERVTESAVQRLNELVGTMRIYFIE